MTQKSGDLLKKISDETVSIAQLRQDICDANTGIIRELAKKADISVAGGRTAMEIASDGAALAKRCIQERVTMSHSLELLAVFYESAQYLRAEFRGCAYRQSIVRDELSRTKVVALHPLKLLELLPPPEPVAAEELKRRLTKKYGGLEQSDYVTYNGSVHCEQKLPPEYIVRSISKLPCFLCAFLLETVGSHGKLVGNFQWPDSVSRETLQSFIQLARQLVNMVPIHPLESDEAHSLLQEIIAC
ncbi:hypothetical protein SELMODRAFT_427619 [Selaginella moellendorffii]|uniref:Uncharacterized protein n=1 Tax=Selaginella moellendorffii TaxID=88036 RepID=D8T068_SELML|nr:uncharacterized protein LOC9628887 [Selaginella moellendorffii]EFJ10029.1 hypothetical protein SELMODRAFT_427619 [Selaginella moellendorffii]|eukprot:XP_002989000.1 uncharacterized protein LOC9628887 [Selaginella moellendorffii]